VVVSQVDGRFTARLRHPTSASSTTAFVDTFATGLP